MFSQSQFVPMTTQQMVACYASLSPDQRQGFLSTLNPQQHSALQYELSVLSGQAFVQPQVQHVAQASVNPKAKHAENKHVQKKQNLQPVLKATDGRHTNAHLMDKAFRHLRDCVIQALKELSDKPNLTFSRVSPFFSKDETGKSYVAGSRLTKYTVFCEVPCDDGNTYRFERPFDALLYLYKYSDSHFKALQQEVLSKGFYLVDYTYNKDELDIRVYRNLADLHAPSKPFPFTWISGLKKVADEYPPAPEPPVSAAAAEDAEECG